MCGKLPIFTDKTSIIVFVKEAAKLLDISKYLARVGLENTGAIPDQARLKLLQKQHLLNVPFENLDIHWKRRIELKTEKFYEKIVGENRGGFCYELNGLFNELLRASGFETRLLSARVSDGQAGFSPEYDHLAIMVIIGEMHYLVDVGFGSFTAEPLLFVIDTEHHDETGIYMIRPREDEYFEVIRKDGNQWRSEYMFKPYGHDLSEFTERCDFHQSSPDSHFMKGKVCSLMTLDGRKTLSDDKFVVNADGNRKEFPVKTAEEFNQILLREFGIVAAAAVVV